LEPATAATVAATAAAAVRQRTEVVADAEDADADAADSGERHDAAAAPPAKKQSQSRTRLKVAQDAVETCTKKLTEARATIAVLTGKTDVISKRSLVAFNVKLVAIVAKYDAAKVSLALFCIRLALSILSVNLLVRRSLRGNSRRRRLSSRGRRTKRSPSRRLSTRP